MIKVKSISFPTKEGRIGEVVQAPFLSFAAADSMLRHWALDAPADGCYHKTNFKITWEDGETYEGRFDLKRHDAGHVDLLGRHVLGFLQFYAGDKCPGHMTPEAYAELMANYADDNPDMGPKCLDMLKRYQIGVGI